MRLLMSRPYSTGVVFKDTSARGSGAHDDLGQQANGTGKLPSTCFLMLSAHAPMLRMALQDVVQAKAYPPSLS